MADMALMRVDYRIRSSTTVLVRVIKLRGQE